MTIRNPRRAKRFAQAIRHYGIITLGADSLIDMLTDARHWCDRHGLCYGDLDRIAHKHYLAEIEDEWRLS